MKGDDLKDLPVQVKVLFRKINPPERLIRHLKLVHDTANKLIDRLTVEWVDLELDSNSILFGAATHDIGKTIVTAELYQNGNKHELEGQKLLSKNGVNDHLSRFTITHGNWRNENLLLEDLLVILADKIWKGKRIIEMEELVTKKLSERLGMDYWDAFPIIDNLLSRVDNRC